MKKGFVLLTVLLLVALVAGGVFLWSKVGQKKGKPADYTVSEQGNERIVENKKAGLKVIAPEGWTVEKIDVEQGSMVFYSPDAKGVRAGKPRPPLKKGCVIEVAVAYKKTNLEDIKSEAEEAHESLIMKSDQFETVEIDAKPALKNIFESTDLGFSIEELTPLNDCVKDTGRNVGRSIGVPEALLTRHPFPGPGLAVRIEGEITAAKLRIARQIDEIYIRELRERNLYEVVWQAGAVVTQSITTCTKGDDAVSGYAVALWAVWSVNGFTAQAAELPWDFVKRVSQRITNEVREVGAVVYGTSDNPPATIEWG